MHHWSCHSHDLWTAPRFRLMRPRALLPSMMSEFFTCQGDWISVSAQWAHGYDENSMACK